MQINKQHIDLQYFGDIKFISTLIKSTNAFFLPDVRYEKSLHLNRTCLIGANGPLLLTVPLIGGRDKKQKLKDVQISYVDPWQKIQWRGIDSSYRKAPWFEDYAPELKELFQLKEKYLLDLNLKTMEWVMKRLKVNVDILADSAIFKKEAPENSGEETGFQYLPYQQVFMEKHGFKPNISILDLLLCQGPSAKKYLEAIATLKNDDRAL
ncbi:MAG: WbqC family protein [Lacibacter sp.]